MIQSFLEKKKRSRKESTKTSITAELSAFIAPACISFFWINTIWVPTQGWYFEWAKYVQAGKLPYQDFYLPFPPLMVYLNRLFLLFSDPLIAERIIMLTIYSLLSLGLFKLTTHFTSRSNAIILTLVSVLVFQLSPTNTIAGYFETAMLFCAWGWYWSLKGSRYLQFLGGMGLAMGSLIKQNFLPLVAIFIFYSLYQLFQKQDRKSLVVAFGGSLIYALFSIYLLFNGIFSKFLEVMLQGGGKSPTLIHLFINLVAPLKNPFFFLTTLCMYLTTSYRPRNIWERTGKYLVSLMILEEFLHPLLGNVSHKKLWEMAVALFFGTALCIKHIDFSKKIRMRLWTFVLILISSGPPVIFYLNRYTNKIGSKYLRLVHLNQVGLFFSAYINYFLWLATVCAFFYFAYHTRFFRRDLLSKTRTNDKFNLSSNQTLLLIGFGLSGLLNSFNGGADFDGNLIFAVLVLAISLGAKELFNTNPVIVGSAGLALLLSSFTIGLYNYSWFGWNESVATWDKVNAAPSNVFRNFTLSTPEFNFYQKLKILTDQAKKIEATTTQDTPEIYTFPMQPIVNFNSGVNEYQTYCPILHFDICPDNAAELVRKELITNPPEIVVVFDLGDEFITANEKQWRSGHISEYRKIRDFLLSNNRYIKVGVIKSDSENLSEVTVLALNRIPSGN